MIGTTPLASASTYPRGYRARSVAWWLLINAVILIGIDVML